ncbi:MAG: hypothetical protein M1824_004836 [Vezdaea acicularis]|nr:MAG: hypothetical protein M1824_004836 [Vezdaea acicularis]
MSNSRKEKNPEGKPAGMASFFNSVRQNFKGGQSTNNKNNLQRPPGIPSLSPSIPSFQPSSNQPPRLSPLSTSPSLSSSLSMTDTRDNQNVILPKPLFLNPKVQTFIVKGNFMTIAIKPKLIEIGEWLAHQVVEQHRVLLKLLEEIQIVNEITKQPACNIESCPTMSAGYHTYTWLDNNRNPMKLPAPQYIKLVSQWIETKCHDQKSFVVESTAVTGTMTYASGSTTSTNERAPIPAGPTSLSAPLSQLAGSDWIGKTSGFPEDFFSDCRNIYRQMFRMYAHMYWNHFKEPFYDLSNEKHLNSSFTHFVLVGSEFDLLKKGDVEPLNDLLELWCTMKVFPPDGKIMAWYNVPTGTENERYGVARQ